MLHLLIALSVLLRAVLVVGA